jgi:hypothetical protein
MHFCNFFSDHCAIFELGYLKSGKVAYPGLVRSRKFSINDIQIYIYIYIYIYIVLDPVSGIPKSGRTKISYFFPADFLWRHFPMLVVFKTGALQFFNSPPCANGATVDSLLIASRRQLSCLHLFIQWMT